MNYDSILFRYWPSALMEIMFAAFGDRRRKNDRGWISSSIEVVSSLRPSI